MIQRENIDENVLVSLNKRNENWQIVEDIRNDLITQKEDYANNIFKVKNEIVNGSFEKDLESWNIYGVTGDNIREISTMRALRGDKSIRLLRKAAEPYGFGYQQLLPLNEGNLYYIKGDVFVPSTSMSRLGLRLETPSVGAITFDVSKKNQWQTKSLVMVSPVTADGFVIFSQSSDPSFDSECFVDGVVFINLTEVFGVGNEPTKEEMDMLIDILGGWFDGEITLSQKQLAIWTLNMIRQNRNAIISLGGTIV